ncbi:hypothetical protein CEUSTIGMA_g11192.t1 [Chlamydomonas eustigma]|uniref:Mediator of RNA polymerase II transcription subunit 21 n=1 Tax=Chlamydomonas eustigma TaxID=1157962 RepID=A0A250XL18_9CHLO|nr:hypothetical protein CEUSTIGMA_g11192.t1 [Chlamydomonas eustigma]|eukprot:GAX83767.1 hypothetical protein CEUSTIGMA_g11192.t1 [Chlamydomonas eustigma]
MTTTSNNVGGCVDLVSQMQFELNRMSELFLSTVGELQRDAGPVPVNNEELIRPTTSYDSASRSKGFALELMQASTNMTLMISKLPTPMDAEQDQLARILDLQCRNIQLEKELEAEFQRAQQKLAQAQDLYGLLAEHELNSHMAMKQ